VESQFLKHVKPMHDRFVEPCKAYADVVVRDLGEYASALEEFSARYLALLNRP
jgi:uridine kinase